MNLPFRVSEWNNPLITLQGKGIDFPLDAPTSPLVRNTKPCQALFKAQSDDWLVINFYRQRVNSLMHYQKRCEVLEMILGITIEHLI